MQRSSTTRSFAYRVNADNRIEAVSSEWLSFARDNQASHLTADAVIGQPLFQFLTGKETKHLYEMIIGRVQRTQESVVIPFRCDGPTLRRFMELTVSPSTNGGVQFAGRIVREEERDAVSLFGPSVSRADDFVVVCSWCKRVEVSGCWFEVEDAVKRLKVFTRPHLPQITHGICVECEKRVQREVDEAG